MIAIIYYQELTLIGVISIVLSLLSVSTKSFIFSSAVTLNVFIFNWLSLVTDFFGIFCSLSFVFYNYNSDKSGIITEWGYIWIFQSIGVWSILCVWFGLLVAPNIVTEDWYYVQKDHSTWSLSAQICNMIIRTIFWFFVFVAGSVFAFMCTNIGLFAPIALVCITSLLHLQYIVCVHFF